MGGHGRQLVIAGPVKGGGTVYVGTSFLYFILFILLVANCVFYFYYKWIKECIIRNTSRKYFKTWYLLPIMYYPACTTQLVLPNMYYPACTTQHVLPSMYYPACTTHHVLPSMYYPACITQHVLTNKYYPACTTQMIHYGNNKMANGKQS